MDVSIDAITNNIQLALAPVFLLTAVATLINAISGRLARTVDRMRSIHSAIHEGSIKDEKILLHMRKEAEEAKMRGRLCTAAIFFDVLSGVFISLTVLELFFFQAGAVRSLQTSYVIWTFVLGLLSFMTSLSIVLAEVVYAYRSAGWNVSRHYWFPLLLVKNMNKILITGGAGFLGSHLTEKLLKEGNDVLVVDNYFTGTKENLAHLLPNPKLELMRHDVTFPLYVETNQIYNLACPASPVHYQYDPVQTTKTSVHGAINMLGLAKRTRARILQASTSEVYGDPEVHPQPEEYWGKVNPIGIRSCYDEGKRCAETLFFDYNRQHNLDIKVVRIFNTYGPRMHPNDGRVVSNFIVQALQGQDITIYGDGQQTRSFCYVDDLIDAMVRMMNSDDGFTGPVNIGNPGEFTMLQLAETVLKLSGSKSKIIYQPLPSDDPKQRQPNIELAKAKLGWEPKVNLEDGLKETIAYFRKVVA